MDSKRRGQGLCTTQHLYRIDRRDISFLRYILEAYDGMAVVTTRDAAQGIVSVTVAPGCEGVVAGVLEALTTAGEIYLEPLAAGEGSDQVWELECTSCT
ncbi:MAG: DUF4911 domain-containing protein [Desulfobacterales bacterium]|nr:DUF4911 domain-containing protein [Desulfobacterales bacterium]